MKNLKYITWKTEDGIPAFVVFPQHLQHKDVWAGIRRMRKLVSLAQHGLIGAGFVSLASSTQGQQWTPYGHSESLGVAFHPSDFQTLNT